MAAVQINTIIFVDKLYIDIFGDNFSSPLRFSFPADSVQHLEIISKEKFVNELSAFLTNSKMPPAVITLLLSDHFLFCKEVQTESVTVAKEAEELQEFLEAVPFEHVMSKIYKLDKREIIAATNQDVIDCMREIFSKSGHRIDACVPVFLLGMNMNLQNGLQTLDGRNILTKLSAIKPWTLPMTPEISPIVNITPPVDTTQTPPDTVNAYADTPASTPNAPKKSSTMRIFALVGAFILLIIIFVVMFIRMNAENASVQKKAPVPTPEVQATSTSQPPAPQNTPATINAFSATADEQTLNVSLQYVAGTSKIATQLQHDLNAFGIQNIISTQSASLSGNADTVLFASNIPAATKQRLLSVIQKDSPTATGQDNSDLSTDILILLPN